MLVLAAVIVLIAVLIGYEQISALYVLCTLALVTLLLLVGWSDLEGVKRTDTEGEGV